MSVRPRARTARLVRRVAHASPSWIAGPAARAVRSLRRDHSPLVSVVVSVSDDETTKIRPAIESVRNQSHRNLDIIVVPYGRAMRVTAIARAQAADDWRIRVLSDTATDLASARDLGASRARGTYLQFLRGGDDLRLRGVERQVATLEASGSSFAVAMMAPSSALLASVTAPDGAAHDVNRSATTLADFPDVVTDLTLGNRTFRTSVWNRSGLSFGGGRGSDASVALAAFDAGGTFDVTRHVVYEPTDRKDGAAVGTMPNLMETLRPWIEEQRSNWAAVQALEVDGATTAWLRGVLDFAIQPFLDDIERATDDDWDTLRSVTDLLLSTAGDSVWSALRAESKVKLWLLQHNRREQLEDFATARWFQRDNRPTRVEGGRVYAELPFFRDPAVGIPDRHFEMTEAETSLQAILTGVRWVGTESLELDLLVRADFVGMPDDPDVSIDLVHRAGARVPGRVVRRDDPAAHQVLPHKHQDYSRGAVTLVIDPAEIVKATPQDQAGADWRIEITLVTQGLRRVGRVGELDDRGSAGMLATGHLGSRAVGERRLTVVAGKVARVALRVEDGHPIGVDEVELEGRRLRGRLVGESSRVRASLGSTTVEAAVVDGSFDLSLPRVPGAKTWKFRGVRADGTTSPVAWPVDAGQWISAGGSDLVLSRSTSGSVELREARDILVLERADLTPDGLEIEARWLGTAPGQARLALLGQRTTLRARDITVHEGRLTARFATSWDEWGFGRVPVPTGRYWFELSAGPTTAPREGSVIVSEDLLDNLLEHRLGEDFQHRVIRLGRSAGVFLRPPVPDDCRGPFPRQQLIDWANSDELPIDEDAVYFQSYTGGSATDSQLAIFREVRRRHPELTCWWGVADHSSWVPEGAQRVVISTREWFRVLASARRLVMNIDLDRWFSPRPGQELLQTFHGYPAKSMGVVLWEAKRYTPRRIQAELDRTSADWDLILTPAPEMDEYYRREYRYDGPIHNEGYPRDDVLVSADADRIREETRARLGIKPGQKAVLYAPTWRDDQATNWRSAEIVRHLDLEAASAQLGDDYVFLMRGHRFHASAGEQSTSTARLVDVTDYPEINDLILASDAAVLDYSSLRFDFAQTGRPMLFLVPDLADYVRGFLYSFEDSAPGPLLDTADQVIARLRDLPALAEEYADELARFNATYNRYQDGRASERVVRAFFG